MRNISSKINDADYYCAKYIDKMAHKTPKKAPAKSKSDLEFISRSENLLIEKEKRYQREDRRPQVEKLTTLHEVKKKGRKKH